MARLRFNAIKAETAAAWLVSGIGGVERWLPKSQASLLNYARAVFDVSSWFWQKVAPIAYKRYAPDKSKRALQGASCDGTLRVSLDGCFAQQSEAVAKLAGLRLFALLMAPRTGKTRAAALLLANHAMHGRIDRVLWLVTVTAKAEMTLKLAALPAVQVMVMGLETLSSCGRRKLDVVHEFIGGGNCALIVDESHLCKNPLAVRSLRLETIAARCPVRGLLSGSSITRNIDDLFHPFKLLDWRILGYRSHHQFSAAHLVINDKHPGLICDAHGQDLLAQRMAPFVYEYQPADVAVERRAVEVPLSQEQREAYGRLKGIILARMRESDNIGTDVYLLFVALQSVLAGHVSERIMRGVLRKDNAQALELDASNKLGALRQVLTNTRGPVVIWCSRRHEVATIGAALPGAYTLTGDTPMAERHAIITAFRSSENGRLVAMTPVAKNSLDMFEADTAVFYGHSFDYEHRMQAEARILLPDIKTHTSTMIDLRYQDSLDERIAQSYAKKQNVIREFMALLRADKARAITEMEAL